MVKTAAISKPPLLRLVLLQMLATTLLMLAIGWYQHWEWSVLQAAMTGGLIATTTGCYFAWRAFLHPAEAIGPERMLADMFQAALLRVMLVGLALAVAFKWGDHFDKPVLLGSFIAISLFGVICNSFLLGGFEQSESNTQS